MEEKKQGNGTNKGEEDLIEQAYEKVADSDDKRGKRLREKELYSKKSDLSLRRGRVLEVFSKSYYKVRFDNEEILCPLSGRLKNIEFDNRAIVVVGDYVQVDFSQHPRIEEIEERKNSLKRYIERGKKQQEVVIAANIDQVVITTSCAEPPLNLNLVDRYLCAAAIADIKPVICINKMDIADNPEEIRKSCRYYEGRGVSVLYTSAAEGDGINDLKDVLHDRDSVFSGVSGAGKSSLINRLDPSLELKTGEVSQVTYKGKHTTSSSRLLPWSFGGYLIDTPGIKTFGLHKDDRQSIPRIFPGFDEWVIECKFTNCSHISEDSCRVLRALEEGDLPEERYQSYLNILTSLE